MGLIKLRRRFDHQLVSMGQRLDGAGVSPVVLNDQIVHAIRLKAETDWPAQKWLANVHSPATYSSKHFRLTRYILAVVCLFFTFASTNAVGSSEKKAATFLASSPLRLFVPANADVIESGLTPA